ncbi:uncharacterized protein LOC121765378 isoform X2 [Salvia splendens]|uniref:uncharacterized protein LOC121765378 isoform X2 n=1 Tax=Salvia splendens TaxID=180675 RepID=UPI001C26D290|nr:uncharacterized protein LOC121765378 isoform X2 [Salvia splendens]
MIHFSPRCLVLEKPQCILKVRDQGYSVASRGRSCLGSPQEFLDYIHHYSRPDFLEPGPYRVPAGGFRCSYWTAFEYVMNNGLAPVDIYPWVGSVCTSRDVVADWDDIVEVGGHQFTYDEKIHIDDYRYLEDGEVEMMLHDQPVTGGLKIPLEFNDWNSQDIWRGGFEFEDVAHALTIVGYGRKGDD